MAPYVEEVVLIARSRQEAILRSLRRNGSIRSAIRDHAKGRTEALEELAVEMLARGLSVRDIEDAFRADDARLLLSRTAVSELGEQLWRDYQDFATRDLSKHEIVYLFVDGIGLGVSALASGASR